MIVSVTGNRWKSGVAPPL